MQSGIRLVTIMLGAMLVAAVTTFALSIISDRYLVGDVRVTSSTPQAVFVQVEGAVATPGVYSLPSQARLVDLVSAAGGLRPDARTDNLNLAARMGDGEVVIISTESPAPTGAVPIAGTPVGDIAEALVDINTASLPILETLPGIGPVLGQRIIDEREQHGPFASVEDLVRVSGISGSLVETLRPLVTTGGE